jgi:hypothetical protein
MIIYKNILHFIINPILIKFLSKITFDLYYKILKDTHDVKHFFYNLHLASKI